MWLGHLSLLIFANSRWNLHFLVKIHNILTTPWRVCVHAPPRSCTCALPPASSHRKWRAHARSSWAPPSSGADGSTWTPGALNSFTVWVRPFINDQLDYSFLSSRFESLKRFEKASYWQLSIISYRCYTVNSTCLYFLPPFLFIYVTFAITRRVSTITRPSVCSTSTSFALKGLRCSVNGVDSCKLGEVPV